jgi:acyl-CoA synthetase (NDP forming)/RimJ/RimL family protein N-acetyltransferase
VTSGDAAVRAALVRDVLLNDGSTLRLREPSAEDLDDIIAFYEALSPESRYMRFHGYGRTDRAARALVEARGVDRAALIGRQGERVIAVAQYELLREPGAAEVAFAVADDFQRRGAATRMLEQLAAVAAARGVSRFDAWVLSDNVAMLSVFRRVGFGIRRRGIGGEITVSLDLRSTAAVREGIAARDHQGVIASLQALLAPTSVAVLDPGPDPADPARLALGRLRAGGFRGKVVSLEQGAELVLAAPPAAGRVAVARQAAAAGARVLVLLRAREVSPGSESDDEADGRLLEIVRGAGMRLVGPNSLGVLNSDPAVALEAMCAGPAVACGRLAVCSQSGAVGVALLAHAGARQLGISSFASLGSRLDVSTNDLLELWEEDPATGLVMLYVESFGNPRRFARIARRVARSKPILAVKGHRQAASRTPPLTQARCAADADDLLDAMLTDAGVQRFRSGEELFDVADFFSRQPLPAGRRVAIVSNSAGAATLGRDALAAHGLALAEGSGNPAVVDLRAAAGELGAAAARLAGDPASDALIAFYVDPVGGDAAAVLAEVSRVLAPTGKPGVASVLTADGSVVEGDRSTIPNLRFPDACAAVLARAVQRREWLARPLGERPALAVDARGAGEQVRALRARHEDGHPVEHHEAIGLLATHGLPLEPTRRCTTPAQAVAEAAALAAPVALKAELPQGVGGAGLDGVLLGLEGERALRAGWRELERRLSASGATLEAVLIQPLMEPGLDLLLGSVRDDELGQVMLIGLGGRQAALGGTAAFRLPPVTDVDADELIEASPAVARALESAAGGPEPADRASLRELCLRLALLLDAAPEITELALNPVRCLTTGCAVLDTRLVLGPPPRRDRVKTW